MKKRAVGIELLRIMFMMMILVLHVNLNGGVLYGTEFGGINYFTAWLLESFCYCSVSGYAMITGYVCCDGNFRYSKIIPVWLQVFFWTALINVVFVLSGAKELNLSAMSFMPITNDIYWYFSCYAGMFMLIPFFNKLIERLDFKEFTILAVTLFGVFSLYSNSFAKDKDPFCLLNGFSMVWISAAYFFGAYVKKYGSVFKVRKRTWAAVYIISSVVPGMISCMLDVVSHESFGELLPTDKLGGYMFGYNSPFITIAALSLLMIFKDTEFRSPRLNSLICFFGASSFGVYIIHTHPLIFKRILVDAFTGYAQLSAPLMALCIIATAIAGYIILALAERCRILAFDLLKVRERIFNAADFISDKLSGMKLK